MVTPDIMTGSSFKYDCYQSFSFATEFLFGRIMRENVFKNNNPCYRWSTA